MVLPDWACELVNPCLTCDPCPAESDNRRKPRRSAPLRRFRSMRLLAEAPQHKVELVTSPLAGLKGVAGYHTSVLLAGEEYYFAPSGIRCCSRLTSHGSATDVNRIRLGTSPYSGFDLLDSLTAHFQPGTYDLLRKNCNNFTDCALFLLTGQRLDDSFRSVETLGLAMDQTLGLVQAFSGGRYLPNQQAEDYDHDCILESLGEERRHAGLEMPQDHLDEYEESECFQDYSEGHAEGRPVMAV
eukprot:TRINITY_DN25183_c0_g1_i2.p1 TRINITY_DN25183_c0_g1~~TRINITY_DN25183_c0_g1_i2.p1  ORF type:complete len:249 (-),score=41.56 TRINITY_DN25183_c0_g1_i2:140-865(-)